jgi:hypothetical protein
LILSRIYFQKQNLTKTKHCCRAMPRLLGHRSSAVAAAAARA